MIDPAVAIHLCQCTLCTDERVAEGKRIAAQLAEKDKEMAKLREESRQQYANAAFYKSCALSGEIPEPGAEPYPMQENSDE
jgi:hypothetical protein